MAQHVKLKEGVSKMEEVIEWVMKFGHGVKGLSEMEMSNLPEQYIQPESERLSNMKMIIPSESHDSSIIPIIDMSNCDTCKDEYDPTLVKTVCEAAQKWGFFQIINHGVPAQALEDVKRATIAFFGLPPEEKRKYLKENSPSNHVRLSTSFIPDAETTLEWKDYLSLFYVSDEETLDIWPPICREQLLDYIRKCQVLIKPLAQMLMKGLNIDMVDEKKWSLLTGSLRINLNYYPKCPKPELTVGVGRHSDVSTFTILLQDNIGGLYVRAPDEESWVHVAPVAGALVINVGDALQILSNGKYKSIEHRVIANGSVDRISIPLFVNPNPNQVIGPLEEVLMQTGEKPKYKNILYSDYTLHFYRKAHDGKATLEFVKK